MDHKAEEILIDLSAHEIGSNGNEGSARRNKKLISVSRDDSYIIEGGSAFRSAPHLEEYDNNNGNNQTMEDRRSETP